MQQRRLLNEEYNNKLANLMSKMRWLSQELMKAHGRLEVDPKSHINSSGLVQGMGSDIDRLCAELSTLKYAIELIETMEQESQ
jgi:hypothetical protein